MTAAALLRLLLTLVMMLCIGAAIINTSYQKLPFGSGDDPAYLGRPQS